MLDASKLSVIYEPAGRAREYAPLACNLAVGCSHECKYCYGPSAAHKAREEFMAGAVPVKDPLDRLRRDAEKLQAAGDERTVLFSFLTDPYPRGQKDVQALTAEALAIMRAHECSFTILTKNGMRARDDFELYTPGRDVFATSIIHETDIGRQHWEPGAGSVIGRWHALAQARRMGIDTWISVEPVISPREALEVVRRAANLGVGHLKIGPLNHHPLAKTISWRRFGEDLAETLAETGIDYYLKHDMRPYMPPDFPVTTLPPQRGVEPPLTCAVCGAEVVMPSDPQGGLFAPHGPLRCSHDPTHAHGCCLRAAPAGIESAQYGVRT